MRAMNEQTAKQAQEFAARWGFLTRDLFFDFFCQKSRAQQFRYWNDLLSKGLFVKSKVNPDVFFLSYKSRSDYRGMARPSRFHLYVDHDAIVARVLLTLGSYGVVSRYWLEDELMKNPMDAYSVLGASKIHRIPDMVFDLKTRLGTIRCALEIEKTVKPQSRYQKMALAYLDYRGVNLILFGCTNRATESAVQRSFSGKALAEKNVVPGLFLYPEFEQMKLASPVRFNEKEFSFQNMLQSLTKRPLENLDSKRDVSETAVSFRNSKTREAG
jgi:hypothetical protein